MKKQEMEIADIYIENLFKNKIDDLPAAIKEVQPTLKRLSDKAWRLRQNPDFAIYITTKIKEHTSKDLELASLMKGTADRLKEALGIKERVLIGESSKNSEFFFSDPVLSPNSKEAKDYLEVYEKLVTVTTKLGSVLNESQKIKEFEYKKDQDELANARADRSQDREDKRLEMDIERFEVDRQKIMSEEKKSDPKKLIIEVID